MQVYHFLLDFLVKLKRNGHKTWEYIKYLHSPDSKVDAWQYKRVVNTS